MNDYFNKNNMKTNFITFSIIFLLLSVVVQGLLFTMVCAYSKVSNTISILHLVIKPPHFICKK